jgi:restriction system protein
MELTTDQLSQLYQVIHRHILYSRIDELGFRHFLERARDWHNEIEKEIYSFLRSNPEKIISMKPRLFEQFIAGIFRNQGFSVELTPPVSDGGIDILAVQNDNYTGQNTYLVQCKRYDPSKKKVGVGVVRELLGVVYDMKATKGIIVTSSFFTKGALDFSERNMNNLSLKDYNDIINWLKTIH